MKEHNWEEPDETLIEIPAELGLGNETFVTASNESANEDSWRAFSQVCARNPDC